MKKRGGDYMSKFNFRRKILINIIVLWMTIYLCGKFFGGFAALSSIQYKNEISDMNSVDAKIVDITRIRSRDTNIKKWICVIYEVDGIMYKQEFKMIVDRLFQLRKDVNYSVGDRITIYYKPENPTKIAYPNSAQKEEKYDLIFLSCAGVLIIIDCLLDGRSTSARLIKSKRPI